MTLGWGTGAAARKSTFMCGTVIIILKGNIFVFPFFPFIFQGNYTNITRKFESNVVPSFSNPQF